MNLISCFDPESVVFITQSGDTPRKNALKLSIINMGEEEMLVKNDYKLTINDELPTMNETVQNPKWDALTRIYLQPFWGEQTTDLCSLERGMEIVASMLSGDEKWSIKLMAEGYFIIIPDATVSLKKRTGATFLLDNVVSSALVGLTPINVYVCNLPGQEDSVTTLSLAKVLPLKLASFTAEPNPVLRGSKVTLSWKVEGATSIRLNNVDVDPEASAEYTPRARTVYRLNAQGQYSQQKSAEITVEVSEGQWTNAGVITPTFEASDKKSSNNHLLVEHDKAIYAASNGKLYTSTDGKAFTSMHTIESSNYSLADGRDGVTLLGQSGSKAVIETYAKGAWTSEEFPYAIGKHAALWDGKQRMLASIESTDACVIYLDRHHDNNWQMLWMMDDIAVQNVMFAECDDKLWLVITQKASATTVQYYYIYEYVDGDWECRKYYPCPKCGDASDGGMLLAHKTGLYLVTRDGIYANRCSGSFRRESTIPQALTWSDPPPYYGICNDKLWFITADTRTLWTYGLY